MFSRETNNGINYLVIDYTNNGEWDKKTNYFLVTQLI